MFGTKTAMALDRYLRVRRAHAAAAEPWLWLGHQGRIGGNGIAQMLRRRCRLAGLPELRPHQLATPSPHAWIEAGGNEGDLMRLAGWRSREMLARCLLIRKVPDSICEGDSVSARADSLRLPPFAYADLVTSN